MRYLVLRAPGFSRDEAVSRLVAFAQRMLDSAEPGVAAIVPYNSDAFSAGMTFGVVSTEALTEFLTERAMSPFVSESLQTAQSGWFSGGYEFHADDERSYNHPTPGEYPPNLIVVAPLSRRKLHALVQELGLESVYETRYGSRGPRVGVWQRLVQRRGLIRELRDVGYFPLRDFDFGGALRGDGGVLPILDWVAGVLESRSAWGGMAWWGHWTRPVDQNGQAMPRGSSGLSRPRSRRWMIPLKEARSRSQIAYLRRSRGTRHRSVHILYLMIGLVTR